MPIAEIAGALSSLKAATDIAKFVKEAGVSLEKAEAKLKLAELLEALADAKLQVADISNMLAEKDLKISELTSLLETKEQLIWREPCYWLPREDGEEEAYCQKCYDSSRVLSRLHSNTDGAYFCTVCGTGFRSRERAQQDAAELRRALESRRAPTTSKRFW